MKYFQIPELQAKLKHARALAADPSTTPHEREAAKRAAGRIEARLKEREGVEGSTFQFPGDADNSYNWAEFCRSVEKEFWAEVEKAKMRRSQGSPINGIRPDLRQKAEQVKNRRPNPAYPKAY